MIRIPHNYYILLILLLVFAGCSKQEEVTSVTGYTGSLTRTEENTSSGGGATAEREVSFTQEPVEEDLYRSALLDFPWIPSVWLEVENNGARWGYTSRAASSRGAIGILFDEVSGMLEFHQYLGMDAVIYTVGDAGKDGDAWMLSLTTGYDDYRFIVRFFETESGIYQWEFPEKEPMYYIRKEDEALYPPFSADLTDLIDSSSSQEESIDVVKRLYQTGEYVAAVETALEQLRRGDLSSDIELELRFMLAAAYVPLVDPFAGDQIILGETLIPIEVLYDELRMLKASSPAVEERLLSDPAFDPLREDSVFLQIINDWDMSDPESVLELLQGMPEWYANRLDYLNNTDIYIFYPGNRFFFQPAPIPDSSGGLIEVEERRGSYQVLQDILVLLFDDGESARYAFPDERGIFYSLSGTDALLPFPPG